RVDHVARVLEVLIKERMSETAPCIGKQRCYRPAADFFIELVDALGRGKVRLDRIHCSTFAPKLIRRAFELRFIGGNQQIKFVLGALPGELKPNSRGGARDDGKFALRLSHWLSPSCPA